MASLAHVFGFASEERIVEERKYLALTRLVEEVPGMVEGERYYIWHNRKSVWHGPTKEAGEAWASENGITIDRFEPFEP